MQLNECLFHLVLLSGCVCIGMNVLFFSSFEFLVYGLIEKVKCFVCTHWNVYTLKQYKGLGSVKLVVRSSIPDSCV